MFSFIHPFGFLSLGSVRVRTKLLPVWWLPCRISWLWGVFTKIDIQPDACSYWMNITGSAGRERYHLTKICQILWTWVCAAALHLVLTKYHVKHEFEWHSALLAELPSEQLDWIIKLPSNATLWSAVCVCLGTVTPGFSTPMHADCVFVFLIY